jgi:hypothetical protein
MEVKRSEKMKRPNFLIILVDEQRYPPIYENEQIRTWIKTKFRSEDFLKQHGLEFYNHYVGSTACSPSRGTLYPLIFGKCKQMQQEPIYFMTDDNVTKGLNQVTLFGDSYTSVISPNNIEAVIAYLDTGKNGTKEKWKLSKYYDNQQFWTSPGVSDKNLIKTANEDFNSVSYFSIKREPDEAEYEMYNITRDPLEMFNLANNSQQNAKLTNIKEYLIILLYEQCKIKRLHPSSGRIKGKSECQ